MSKQSMVHSILAGLTLITMQATYTTQEFTIRPYVPATDEVFIKYVLTSTEQIMESTEAVIKAKFGKDYKKSMCLREPRLFGRSIANMQDIQEDSIQKNLLNSFVLEQNGTTVAILACCKDYEMMQYGEHDGTCLLHVDLLMPTFTKSLTSLIYQEGLSKLIAIKKQDKSVAGLMLVPDGDDFCDLEFRDLGINEEVFGLTDGDFNESYFKKFQAMLHKLGFRTAEWAVLNAAGGIIYFLPFNEEGKRLANDIIGELII